MEGKFDRIRSQPQLLPVPPSCRVLEWGEQIAMNIKIKRVYEPPEKEDGVRVLVDRLWPRGLTKEKACLDLWLKHIAPTTELRKWFRHDPHKWAEFKARYHAELEENSEYVALLKREIKKGMVTLLYGAKDRDHNEAVVLLEFLAI